MSRRQVAALLLHVADWQLPEPTRRIAPTVALCNLSGTRVAALYERLCAETGIDDGEPLMYEAYALFEPSDGSAYHLGADDPYALADRVANLLAVASSRSLTWSRMIWSEDQFETSTDTAAVHQAGPQTDFLQDSRIVLDAPTVDAVETMWAITNPMWEAEKSSGRVINALSYFYYAWRAHYIEHICLNLAIALEVLFAPHSQSETTHQLCFNLARFAGAESGAREDIYNRVKRFYRIRSSIVHGGIPDDGKIIDTTVDMFHLTAHILKRILTDRALAATFNDSSAQRALWKSYLFD
ncbi:MAG: hypothetical protein AB7L66_05150 [Gemmatimonadales bacterium]